MKPSPSTSTMAWRRDAFMPSPAVYPIVVEAQRRVD